VVAPFSLQRLGRRTTNQLSCLPALAGWGLLLSAAGPTALLASRALQVLLVFVHIKHITVPILLQNYVKSDKKFANRQRIAI
jgi:hypothetical protein